MSRHRLHEPGPKTDPQILERLTRVIMIRMRQARKKTGRVRRAARCSGWWRHLAHHRPEAKGAHAMSDRAARAWVMRVAIVGEEAVGMPAAYFDELENAQ
jgi:hypothetical protein